MSEGVGRLVRAPKTAELIATQLRRQIVRGELKAGDTLPAEVELMAQFGVSRPTLREAFRILETEVLISVRRGSRGGARVMAPELSVAARYVGLLLQLSETTIVDVLEARIAIEPVCAGMLAQRSDPAAIVALHACSQELRDAVESKTTAPDPVYWSSLTSRFHELILQHCGSNTLAVQCGVLQDIVATHHAIAVSRRFQEADRSEAFRQMIRSYRKLVKLVEAGDADGAERHWRTHMEVSAKSLLTGLNDTQVVDLFA